MRTVIIILGVVALCLLGYHWDSLVGNSEQTIKEELPQKGDNIGKPMAGLGDKAF